MTRNIPGHTFFHTGIDPESGQRDNTSEPESSTVRAVTGVTHDLKPVAGLFRDTQTAFHIRTALIAEITGRQAGGQPLVERHHIPHADIGLPVPGEIQDAENILIVNNRRVAFVAEIIIIQEQSFMEHLGIRRCRGPHPEKNYRERIFPDHSKFNVMPPSIVAKADLT